LDGYLLAIRIKKQGGREPQSWWVFRFDLSDLLKLSESTSPSASKFPPPHSYGVFPMKSLLPLCLFSFLFAFAADSSAQVPSKAGDWPQWRGPSRDGISLDKGLLKEWPEAGPKVAWEVNSVGVGYSSIAIKDGRVITQGDLDGVEHIIALDVATGKTLWATQPAPVVSLLKLRIENDLKNLDRDKDGKVSEVEALQRFGWDWNKFNKPIKDGNREEIAKGRSANLLQALDKNADGSLNFSEAGNVLRNDYQRIDQVDGDADPKALAEKRTTAFFAALDKDDDKKISRQESRGSMLDRMFGRIDQRDPNTNRGDNQLTVEEVQNGLEKNDRGRDGVISGKELLAYYISKNAVGDDELTGDELKGAIGGYRNGMGDGPRGTPTIDGDKVYAEGGNGDLVCLDVKNGETVWHVNLSSAFGGGRPGWGYSESPLIVGDTVVVTPGGNKGTIVALNKTNGELVWQSAEVTERAHYASPVFAKINGVNTIVQFARQSVFGVNAIDGKPLWKYTSPANGTANCCAPIVEDNLIFASSGYGTGGGLAKITLAGSTQSAEEVYFEKKMACHHGGIVKVGDHMYSAGGGPLTCMNFKTGEIKWQARGAGKGSICVADGMLYVLGEGHKVALAEVTPEGYNESGNFKIEGHGRPAWAHIVVAGGRMFIRDQESLVAYDVKAE
jgi:outer membrane protein assembly factor BamB